MVGAELKTPKVTIRHRYKDCGMPTDADCTAVDAVAAPQNGVCVVLPDRPTTACETVCSRARPKEIEIQQDKPPLCSGEHKTIDSGNFCHRQ